jgi:transposase
MTIGRKVYSKEFKLEAIKMVLNQGINSTEVGRQLGVDGYSVRNWIKIYSNKRDESFPGSGNPWDHTFSHFRVRSQDSRVSDRMHSRLWCKSTEFFD